MATVAIFCENLLDAIQQGLLTPSTKERLDTLERQKEDLSLSILQAELQRPKYTKEEILCWIEQFKCGDVNDKEYQRRLIETFVNSIYLFDDRVVFTYNDKGGTQTISLAEILTPAVRISLMGLHQKEAANSLLQIFDFKMNSVIIILI